ncbi:MAG: OmpA family protein [Spirochaetes bacterium]|nr:OmpA family protein [Spirochaetota bacterium]
MKLNQRSLITGIKTNLYFYALLLMLVSSSLYGDDVPQVTIENEYLRLSVDMEEGHFILRSLNPINTYITFDEKVPSTSFATIRLKDRNHVYGSEKGQFLVKPKKIGEDRIYSKWKIWEAVVEQVFVLTNNPYSVGKEKDTLKVYYKIVSEAKSRMDIGFRFTLDTLIGENDDVPFFMPGKGDIKGYDFINRKELPRYWYAIDSKENSDFKVQISFEDDEDKWPDKVAIANWEEFRDNLWAIKELKSDSFKRNILQIQDSAVAFYWNSFPFIRYEEKSYSFYYGLYTVDRYVFENFDMIMSMPEKSSIVPFFISLHVNNNSSIPLKNIVASIKSDIDDDFEYIDGQSASLESLDPHQTEHFSWKVVPKEHAAGKYTFEGKIEYELSKEKDFVNSINKEILIENREEIPLVFPSSYFSPDEDGQCDTIDIIIEDTADKEKYLFIIDQSNRLQRGLKLDHTNTLYTWDGKDDFLNTCPDGFYYCVSSYVSNHTILQKKGGVTIDTLPPQIELNLTNNSINIKDLSSLLLFPAAFDSSGIDRWELNIHDNKDYNYFIKDIGDIPVPLIWNFKDNMGKAVVPGDTCMIKLTVFDKACNETSVSNEVIITSGEPLSRIFPNVTFSFDSADIKKSQYPVLDSIVKYIDENRIRSIKIIGHTDNMGAERYNDTLSIKRAKAVKNYILKKLKNQVGDVVYIGKGEDDPIAENQSSTGRSKNRRVEVTIETF